MVFPPGSGTSFSIGRTQDCDLRIADLSVSRRHAQLDRGVNGWLVREPVPVRAGDVLQFGSAVFVIRDGTPAQPDPE
jgi:pSer/pThr/pTyr-binding forkhead associated (FHA) protein